MRPQLSAVFRNRKFTIAILGLVGLLVVGLLSVAGVALLNKMQAQPEPTPTATITRQPTQPPAATATSQPTARPTATQVVVASPTAAHAAATAVPTTPTTHAAPTATPGASGDIPDTGGSPLLAMLAGGGFAALLVLARSGRRKNR
jgi:cytoskeletal protein RodZ